MINQKFYFWGQSNNLFMFKLNEVFIVGVLPKRKELVK